MRRFRKSGGLKTRSLAAVACALLSVLTGCGQNPTEGSTAPTHTPAPTSGHVWQVFTSLVDSDLYGNNDETTNLFRVDAEGNFTLYHTDSWCRLSNSGRLMVVYGRFSGSAVSFTGASSCTFGNSYLGPIQIRETVTGQGTTDRPWPNATKVQGTVDYSVDSNYPERRSHDSVGWDSHLTTCNGIPPTSRC